MFKPLHGRVLIEPETIPEITQFGIILPTSKEKPVNGTVVTDGEDVKKGDRVIFSKFGYDEVTIDKTVYFIVSEANILGIYC